MKAKVLYDLDVYTLTLTHESNVYNLSMQSGEFHSSSSSSFFCLAGGQCSLFTRVSEVRFFRSKPLTQTYPAYIITIILKMQPKIYHLIQPTYLGYLQYLSYQHLTSLKQKKTLSLIFFLSS